MSKPVRFSMVGGFLGAGKTTAIAALARHWIGQGLRVGVVTNDQAFGLVDTQSLREQGLNVGEVTGACFCCKFNDLIETASQLAREERPDIILAEPVGSCTDLRATVIEPLVQLYGDAYQPGPLAVLLKPEHGLKILADEPGSGFSPQAAYIFLKQLEEADVIAINKIDKLTPGLMMELKNLLVRRFPEKRMLATSALEGDGMLELAEALEKPRVASRPLEIDYDVYAAGEAELGWLNAAGEIAHQGSGDFALDDLVEELVAELARNCAEQHAEPAHLKILACAPPSTAIANLVSSRSGVELSRSSGARVAGCRFTINARVAIDPEVLTGLVKQSLERVASEHGAQARIDDVQSFRPGRPVPTHRLGV